MLLSQLASPEQPEIDKFAVLLKPRASQSASSGVEEEECRDDEKMICVVGTNRTSPQGMEVGYVLNEEYWGQGYGSEMFEMFLKYYWTIPGLLSMSVSFLLLFNMSSCFPSPPLFSCISPFISE